MLPGKETPQKMEFAPAATMLYFKSPSIDISIRAIPSSRNEAQMNIAVLDRRGALRHNFKVPLRVRIGMSATPEQRTKSENLSGKENYFATHSKVCVGAALEVLLKMPEEITRQLITEWACSDHLVGVEPFESQGGKFGVGVKFDCHEISRTAAPALSSSSWQPSRPSERWRRDVCEWQDSKAQMNRRALVLDDEPTVCDLIQKVLPFAGMEALTLTRSTEATGLLKEGKFDVVFLDLRMASPDGIELARQMRRTESNRRTPITLISDDQRPSVMSVGFEAGAGFFLYKPIDTARLLKLIRATQGTMEHDRRRTRRVSLQSRVVLQSREDELEAQTVDISPSEVLVRAQ
jgi:CheY-like chemotaxis protein